MVNIPAHVVSFSVLMVPALVYSGYVYNKGMGEDNAELEKKLVSQTRLDGNPRL